MTDATPVTALADELVDVLFDANPLWPALLGVGDTRPGLGDLSDAAEQELRAKLLDFGERARAVDPAGLTGQDRVTRDVVIAHAEYRTGLIDSRFAEFNVTDIFVSPAVGLLTTLPMLPVGTGEEAERHLTRLAQVPHQLEQSVQRYRDGVAAGRTPVAHLVRAAIAHVDRYLDATDADPLRRQPGPEGYAERRDRILRDTVRPAFAAYRDALSSEILAHGRPEDRPGVSWLPDGDKVYALLAAHHTTTDRTPDDLHETGLGVIDRLAGEYAELGARVFGTRDLGEIFERLRTNPALRWSAPDELLESARAAISRAEAEAPKWFDRIPPQPCVVEPVPAEAAPGAPAAYYLWPTADGARPGTYFANTYQAEQRFRHTSEVTAFHEAIPGHHFQLSTSLGLTDLPLLRRVGDFNAYVEGWGLYCERLADEMGLYTSDLQRLGMLSFDALRACRLVVDTGMHHYGWSRQRAVDFLTEHTPMAPVEIESEVDRYIGYPGQALSYMVGRLEIQRLRAEAEAAMGSRFDIREFHDLVLGCGALPLSVLAAVVKEWAA